MRKNVYVCLALFVTLACACNDWLDVRPDTEVKEKEMLSDFAGIRDALTGCYMALADEKLYGMAMTMTNIESLAAMWYTDNNSLTIVQNLKNHLYNETDVQTSIKSMYHNLFNVIAQVNLIIERMENDESVTMPTQMRDVLLGEAYAIRAFCHLDILRLFGQIPQGATESRSLPYALKATVWEMPSYYDFNAYVDLLKADFSKAETFLKESDPLFTYTFTELNKAEVVSKLDDPYLGYRQFRFNFWAVRGLQARMYCYLGGDANLSEAYKIAKEIIEAKGSDGNNLIGLSGSDDLKNSRFACPFESLLLLSKYDILDYFTDNFIGGSTSLVDTRTHYVLSTSMFENELFANRNTASNNRYLHVWKRNVRTSQGTLYSTLKKYYYEDVAGRQKTDVLLYHQVIPLLRLSEIYLIAIETAPSIEESNRLFKTYMASHDENVSDSYFQHSLDLKNRILDSYRIEFFAEGQMFYHYKRLNSANMLWAGKKITEQDYMVPLPASEYDPNKQKN